MGTKIGKSLTNVEQDELHEYLPSLKERMSASSWHTVLYGIKYCYTELLEMPELVNSLPKSRQPQTWQEKLREVSGLDLGQCPWCPYGRMRLRRGLAPAARSPPAVQIPRSTQS